jgi:hypothetical protein
VEHDVPEDELIRNYQKNSSADKRLEEASRLLREATERAEQLAAQMQSGTQPTQKPTNNAPETAGAAPAHDSVVQAKEVLSSLYAGDEDDAATKLANFVEGRAQSLSRERLVRELVPLAVPALQQEISKSDALATLQSDYPDLFTDPDYAQLANAHAGRLLSSGKTTEAEAILGAAQYVVDKFKLKKAGRSGAASPTGVDVDSARRLERKQAADPVPGLGIASGSTGEPTETDRSSVITEMRKARGQLAA